MAHLTVEQSDVVRQLEAEYGEPDIMKIEYTPAPYGLVWMAWSLTASRGPRDVRYNSRNLFIKPDGSRLAWQQIQTEWPEGGLPHGEHPYDYGYGPGNDADEAAHPEQGQEEE